jgi:hypothetical protein
MLTYFNFTVIVAENLVLILHSGSMDEYFTTNSLDQPFVWIQIASTIIAGSVMVAYCVKDLPLLIKTINMTLNIRSSSYGSNYSSYHPLVKISIKLSMVLLNPTFAYHLVYTFVVCLVFYNKLFAALLMLDIFFQIPTLSTFPIMQKIYSCLFGDLRFSSYSLSFPSSYSSISSVSSCSLTSKNKLLDFVLLLVLASVSFL